jgi:hypothetical protein
MFMGRFSYSVLGFLRVMSHFHSSPLAFTRQIAVCVQECLSSDQEEVNYYEYTSPHVQTSAFFLNYNFIFAQAGSRQKKVSSM